MDFNELIHSPEYDFIFKNEHLKDRIILLTLGGSHAYGTNVETSDVDIRGCALNSKSDLLGLSTFDQMVDSATDTTIYSFNKLVSLFLNCNPNTIEMLGCKPEHYFMVSDIGKQLLENKKIFLSKRCVYSFGGYANQQLRRLENALAHDHYDAEMQNKHLVGALESSLHAFNNSFAPLMGGKDIKLYHDADNSYIDLSLTKYPIKDLSTLLNQFNSVYKDYDKLNGRNKKKDDVHLNKHAMHLIRLYLMCLDLLEKEEIITYREKEREMLLAIRNGAYQKEDGSFRSEFFDMVNEYEQRVQYAKENTSLPETPNYKKVEELVMDVNKKSLGA